MQSTKQQPLKAKIAELGQKAKTSVPGSEELHVLGDEADEYWEHEHDSRDLAGCIGRCKSRQDGLDINVNSLVLLSWDLFGLFPE